MRILPRFFIYANELLNYSILYKKLLSNMQSIDSLRELNTKLLAEIAELRRENAEIKIENDELKDKNTEIPELKSSLRLRLRELNLRLASKTGRGRE
jgi:transposase-like protein